MRHRLTLAVVLLAPRGLTPAASAYTRTALPLVCLASERPRRHLRTFVTTTSGLVPLPATADLPVPGWPSSATCGSAHRQSTHPSPGLHLFSGTPSLLKTSWWTLVLVSASCLISRRLHPLDPSSTPPRDSSPHLGNTRNFGPFWPSLFPFFFWSLSIFPS